MKTLKHFPLVLLMCSLPAMTTVGSMTSSNGLAIADVRVLSAKEAMVKNTHELWVSLTNTTSQAVRVERGEYAVVMLRFSGPMLEQILGSSVANTNKSRYAIGGGPTSVIPPRSTFRELVRLEELLRLGRSIPPGEYWVMLLRKCGFLWDDVVTSEPIRITIE